jgi:hypothetical protein
VAATTNVVRMTDELFGRGVDRFKALASPRDCGFWIACVLVSDSLNGEISAA